MRVLLFKVTQGIGHMSLIPGDEDFGVRRFAIIEGERVNPDGEDIIKSQMNKLLVCEK